MNKKLILLIALVLAILLVSIQIISHDKLAEFKGTVVSKENRENNPRVLVVNDISNIDVNELTTHELINELDLQNKKATWFTVEPIVYEKLNIGQKVIVYSDTEVIYTSPSQASANEVKIIE